MSLTPIPDQPVDLEPNVEHPDCVDCEIEHVPCVTFAAGDRLYLQMKNEPDSLGLDLDACNEGEPPTYSVIYNSGQPFTPYAVGDPDFNNPTLWGVTSTGGSWSIAGGKATLVTTPLSPPTIFDLVPYQIPGVNTWYFQPSFYVEIETGTVSSGGYWEIYLTCSGGGQAIITGQAQSNTVYRGGIYITGLANPANFGIRALHSSGVGALELLSVKIRLSLNAVFTSGPDVATTGMTRWEMYDSTITGPGPYAAHCVQTGSEESLTQSWFTPFGPSGFAIGTYRLELDVTEVTSGGVFLRIGSQTSALQTSAGTLTWDVYRDATSVQTDVEVVADPFFVGKINQLRYRTLGGGVVTNGGWSVDGDLCAYRHLLDPPNVNPLVLSTWLTQLGAWVKVTYRLDDLTTGSVRVTTSTGNFSAVHDRAGTYSAYFYLDQAQLLQVIPTQDFDGTFKFVDVALQYRGHLAYLYEGSNVGPQLFSYYERDFVTFYLDLQQGYPACFTVGVLEQISAGGFNLPDYWIDPQLTDPAGFWTLSVTSGTVVTPGSGILSDLAQAQVFQDLAILLDTCVRVTLLLQPCPDIFGNPQPLLVNDLKVYFGGYLAFSAPPISGTQAAPLVFDFTYDAAAVALGATSTMIVDWNGSPCTFTLGGVYAQPCPGSPGAFPTYVSNCLQRIAPNYCENSYLSAGVDGATPAPDLLPDEARFSPVALGFQFNVYFLLALRAPVYFLEDRWQGDDERYGYLNGREQRTASSTQKQWALVIGKQNGHAHDALAVMTRCEWLRVRSAEVTDYVVVSDDYSPNWPKGQRPLVADVSVDVVRREKSRRYLRRIY